LWITGSLRVAPDFIQGAEEQAKITERLTEIHLVPAQTNQLGERLDQQASDTHVAWPGKSGTDCAQELLACRTEVAGAKTGE